METIDFKGDKTFPKNWCFLFFGLFVYSVLGYGAWRGYFISDYSGGDFRWYYYFGAWMVRHGLDIYSPTQIDIASGILGYRPYFPFFHMPPFFLIFVPFTYLPRLLSESLWFFLCHVFVIGACLVILRRVGWRGLKALLFVGMVLLWKPLFLGIGCGQVLLLVFFLLAAAIARLSEREGGIIEGFLIAFVILLKIQFLPLLILLAWLRRWRVLAWAVLGVMGFVLLGMAVYGSDWWILSLQKMSLHTEMQAIRHNDPSLWMVVRRFFQDTLNSTAVFENPRLVDPIAFSIAALFWMGWILSGRGKQKSVMGFRSLLREFGFFALTMIITHPVNVFYSFTMAILLFPEVIEKVLCENVSRGVKAILLIAMLCMNFHLSIFIYTMPDSIRPLPGWFPDPAWMGAVLLWVVFLIFRVKGQNSTQNTMTAPKETFA